MTFSGTICSIAALVAQHQVRRTVRRVLRALSLRGQRDEIEQRVAKFKGHQERLIREREDYAASELKRMLARATRLTRDLASEFLAWRTIPNGKSSLHIAAVATKMMSCRKRGKPDDCR